MKSLYLLISLLLIFSLGSAQDLLEKPQKPTKVIKPAYFDVTQPLRDITPVKPELRDRSWKDNMVENNEKPGNDRGEGSDFNGPDPVLQSYLPNPDGDPPIILQDIHGMLNLSGIAPPDTDGDVGPNHYFHMINLAFKIYDKEGTVLYGPADNSTIWDGFIGPWTGTNDGDPIVMYDEQADRWLVSQFALPNYLGPHYELIAVSATSDPLGEWYRYAYEFEKMPDYPKFGIWSDAYYFTINQFRPFDGAAVCAVDREAMLDGDPDAQLIFWDLANIYFGLLPADADGEMLPPDGAPAIMLSKDYANLLRWEATVNWENPEDSKLEKKPEIPLKEYQDGDIEIEQPGTDQLLDPLSDRLMYRLQYRNFGDYEVLVTNHTVNVGSKNAGIRWYELRSENGGPWQIYQEGTFGPDDGENRWMGSIAMNQDGDIALGYSMSSKDTYPSIMVTGQSAGAPDGLGVFDIPETILFEGSSSQTGVNRWGDYASMSVDPVDDNTFWFTTEYSNGGWAWRTRIFSFGFPGAATANFTSNETIIPVGGNVNFLDLSSGFPDEWQWTFEGGDPATSTEHNPEGVIFATEGTFDVTLLASNSSGGDTKVMEDYITTSPTILPEVIFTASNNFVCPGDEVQFVDLSKHNPKEWLWEFEPNSVTFVNGTDETSQHPEVVFNAADIYDVKLTVWNLNGQSSVNETVYVTVGGIVPYFRETFEDANFAKGLWTRVSNDPTEMWQLVETSGTHPGNTSAAIDLSNYISQGQRDQLISPPFNLTGTSPAVLEFTYAYAQESEGLTDSLIVYISKDCSDDWVKIFEAGEDGTGNFATAEMQSFFWPKTADDWCQSGWGSDCISLDISEWSGEAGVRIAFESVANFGNPLFIDNVTVGKYVGDVEISQKNEEIKIYPNPVSNQLHIVSQSEIQHIRFMNQLGQAVFQVQPKSSKSMIDVSGFPGGIYLVQIETSRKTHIHKVILDTP